MTQSKNKKPNTPSNFEHLDFIIEGARLGTWEWNKQTDQIKYNAIWYELLGYSHEEIKGEGTALWYNIIHPEDTQIADKALQEHIKGKTLSYNCEVRLRHKNGNYIWIQDSGKIMTWAKNGKPEIIAGCHIDIDKRKKNEILLTKYKNLLEKSNSHALIGTWEIDLAEEKLTWSAVTKLIHEVPKNYEPDLGLAINFYKEGENRDRITLLFNESIKNNKPYDDTFEIVTAKGKSKWVRAIGIPILKKETCTGAYGTFQDITKQKLDNIAIRELLVQTKEQNERLLNFAHIVSHNLHSHSGNLTMLLQLFKMENQNIENRIFPMVEKATQSLEETIVHLNEVVAMNTKTVENNTIINIHAKLEKTIESLRLRLKEAEAEITLDVPQKSTITGIKAYTESIFFNLLSNALKYREPSRKLKIRIQLIKKDNQTIITVSDNGKGINLERYKNKIFGMYNTFHPGLSSRGIGLFISKNQIETMGGKMTVDSTEGKGTTFTLSFLK